MQVKLQTIQTVIILIITAIRTVILYFIVTVAIRLMGKRQIGDMQPNELVVTLLISEIAAIPLQDATQPVMSGVMAISVLVVLEILISILAMKSFFVRKIMSGRSIILIKNGVLDQQAMRNVRMTVLDLVELLRGQNVFDISQVAFAVLEVNGGLSVVLKSDARTVTVGDMKLKVPKEGLAIPVISDGRLIKESLTALEISKNDIIKRLKKDGLTTEKVFLMTADRNHNYSIVKKEEKKS